MLGLLWIMHIHVLQSVMVSKQEKWGEPRIQCHNYLSQAWPIHMYMY